MEKINIQIPEGYQIDLEKSDLATGQIIFKKVEKKKPLTFEELERIKGYYIDDNSIILEIDEINDFSGLDINVFPQKDQCEAVLALSQLLQLHKAWKEFDTENTDVHPFTIFVYKSYDGDSVIKVGRTSDKRLFSFNSDELAIEFKHTFISLLEKLTPIVL